MQTKTIFSFFLKKSHLKLKLILGILMIFLIDKINIPDKLDENNIVIMIIDMILYFKIYLLIIIHIYIIIQFFGVGFKGK